MTRRLYITRDVQDPEQVVHVWTQRPKFVAGRWTGLAHGHHEPASNHPDVPEGGMVEVELQEVERRRTV